MTQPDIAADQRRLWIEVYLWAVHNNKCDQAHRLANIAAKEYEDRWLGVVVGTRRTTEPLKRTDA